MSFAARMWLASMALFISPHSLHAQSYPVKPITIILPYAPGGATSTMAYLIRQKLTENWGQQMVMLHRPGANATIGAAAAAKAPPDGYTIVFVTASHVIAPLLMSVPYDPIKDFAPVTPTSNVEVILVAHPSVPVKSLKELIALARARPGELNYATSTAGSASHLAAELFSMRAGIRMQPISYKGGGPAVSELLGGQVGLYFGNPVNVTGHVNAGRLRALAVSGERRLPSLQQVATFGESGFANFDVGFWQGILAPAGTPRPIIDKLAQEIARILAMPDVREKITALGSEPFVSSPDAFAARMRVDSVKYAEVIKKRNIKID